MSKISLVVPVYNGSSHIIDCIKSILSQSYDNIELLIYDDGSSDDSYDVIESYIKLQMNKSNIEVKLIKQENKGVANTRNRGIWEATGDYIAFVDQDDWIEPDYCKSFLELAETTNADIVLGGYTRKNSAGRIIKSVNLKQGEWAKFIVLAPWARIYKLSFLREHDILFLSYGIGEDIYFNLMAYSRTERIITTEYNGYMWSYNPESVSNSKQNCISESVDPLYLLEKIYVNLPNQSFISAEATEYFFARYVVWYFLFTVRRSKRADIARQYDRVMLWLEDKFPDFYKNHYIRLWNRKGELVSIEMTYSLWIMLYRMKLLRPCLLLLAKRN